MLEGVIEGAEARKNVLKKFIAIRASARGLEERVKATTKHVAPRYSYPSYLYQYLAKRYWFASLWFLVREIIGYAGGGDTET